MKTLRLTILLTLLLTACGAPEKPTITLYLAMQRGDIEQIERHIAWGSDMNQLDRDGFAPLHVAVRKGRLAITRLLLKHGVDVNVQDARGHTPMYHAVLGARPRIADLLLKSGAQIDATAWLLDAARKGISEREVIRYLAQHGANLEARDSKGDTPLLIAIRQGNHKLAKHLVNFGADVTVTDAAGKTALEIAKSLDLRDIALLLQRNGAT
ncbi:ankyrin repeat domain-containing protein [Thiolapillus sp.]